MSIACQPNGGKITTQTRTTGGREVPSHYEIHINQEEAKVVNLIFDLKIKGLGKAAIAQELNKRAIVSASRGRKITGRTHNWSQTLIGKMLEREKYIGIWRWGKSTRVQDPDSRKMTKQDVSQNQWVEHFEGKEFRADLAASLAASCTTEKTNRNARTSG